MAKKAYSREKYQSMIWAYEKRRQVYREAMTSATKKIAGWKKMMNRIDERNQQVRNAAYLINRYLHVRLKSTKMDEDSLLARKIFYKYGLEELQLKGVLLSEYLGQARNAATSSRRFFTKSFEKNKKNRETYYRVREYLRNHSIQVSERKANAQNKNAA